MMNLSLPELVLVSVLWSLLLVVVYWVIRLAVRHGVMDARQRMPEPPTDATLQ